MVVPAEPWVSILKWSNDSDNLGHPHFRKPPYTTYIPDILGADSFHLHSPS